MKEKIISDYKSGKSIRELAKIYPQCRKTIKKFIVESEGKIEFRDNTKRKFPLDHSYFQFIDSPQKAYFLGFLFADGYVLSDGYCSGMTLAITDREILEAISLEVYGSTDPVYDIPKMQTNKIPQSRIIFKSKEFQSHLVNKNMIHNKSLTLTPPIGLPDNLIKYFLHGYFDGDGCFSKVWSLLSTAPFCQWISDYLISQGVVSHAKIIPIKNKGTSRLTVWRVGDILSLYKFFYNDPTLKVFLERKRNKMAEFLNKRNLI